MLYHGVGLADEYPTLPHAADWTDDTPDGVLEPGMVLCVESYIGRLGGREGVKIEEQVLITETGNEQLSTYPLDSRLLSADRVSAQASAGATASRPISAGVCFGGDIRQALAPCGPADDLNSPPPARNAAPTPNCGSRSRDVRPALGHRHDRLPMAAALDPFGENVEAFARASRSRVSAMMPDMESRLL